MASDSAKDLRSGLQDFGLERDRLTAALAQAAGVAENDLAAIEHIERAGTLTQTELGARLLLTRGSVTTLVDRLQRAGWLERRPHPTDRRLTVLALCPAAAETATALCVSDYERRIESAARSLTRAERAAVARFLDAATTAAREHAEQLRARRLSSGSGP